MSLREQAKEKLLVGGACPVYLDKSKNDKVVSSAAVIVLDVFYLFLLTKTVRAWGLLEAEDPHVCIRFRLYRQLTNTNGVLKHGQPMKHSGLESS